MIYRTTYESAALGPLTLASDGRALVGLWLEGQKYYGGSVEEPMEEGELPLFEQAKDWLDRYFAGESPSPEELCLAPRGSEFRQRVWRILREIPYGAVRTYGDIAAQIAAETGKKAMASQAVGGAVGHNPISIIIPCHRVVGAQGSLTGYAGGVSRKLWLLDHEGVDTTGLSVPNKGTAL